MTYEECGSLPSAPKSRRKDRYIETLIAGVRGILGERLKQLATKEEQQRDPIVMTASFLLSGQCNPDLALDATSCQPAVKPPEQEP